MALSLICIGVEKYMYYYVLCVQSKEPTAANKTIILDSKRQKQASDYKLARNTPVRHRQEYPRQLLTAQPRLLLLRRCRFSLSTPRLELEHRRW